MPKKRALITGITGQDGSYLAELLLEKDYEVFGLVRRSASPNHWRIEHLTRLAYCKLIEGDLTDQTSLENAIKLSNPDEIYNLAAQSFVGYSFKAPLTTIDVTGVGIIRLLEAIRTFKPTARVFQASSSEQFGKIMQCPQDEGTPFYPRSPYGCAKVFAHHSAINYRETYKMHISCGIMFNHESPRRGEEFVTRKITKGIARIKKRLQDKVMLGNLTSARDWGYAKDYMEGAWLMLQQEKPSDYVLATGETHTVNEWLEETCRVAKVDYGDAFALLPEFERPLEVDYLRGNSSLARMFLNWETTVSFRNLVEMMYKADYDRL